MNGNVALTYLFVDPRPLSPPQFFPYVLLLVAVLMYTPALFWRFSVAPLLQSDLGFIVEELDRCYNRAVTLAKRMATSGLLTSDRYCSPAVDVISDPTNWTFGPVKLQLMS